MSNKGIGASTHKHSSVTPRVQQRSDCCPVEQALSEQLFELLGILKDVTPVYFSGYPPTGGGDYHHISSDFDDGSSLICKARLLIHAIAGRFVDGHLCFESKLLREALYAFCDGLHECSDPNDTKSLDKFEKKLDQLINYLQRVREALANGEAVDDLSFCNEVTKRITSLIDILCNDISQSFSKREKEIRRHPGRSYRRPELADEANGFTDKDRATLDVIKTNIKKTHGEMRDANKRMDAILYCASNGKHGENPDLGGLITLVKHNMVEYGFNLICRDDTLSTAQAAKLTLEKYPPVMGAYKRDDPKDLEDLRQAIYRRCKEAGLLFKTNRKTMS